MFKKIMLSVSGLIAFIIAGGLAYLYLGLPDVGPPPDLSVEGTPEQIEKGRYLSEHVSICIDCHSGRDWSKFSGPIIPGTRGRGGEIFDHKFGFPGIFSRKISLHTTWKTGRTGKFTG